MPGPCCSDRVISLYFQPAIKAGGEVKKNIAFFVLITCRVRLLLQGYGRPQATADRDGGDGDVVLAAGGQAGDGVGDLQEEMRSTHSQFP